MSKADIERLNGGHAIIAPTENSFESCGTSNSGSVYLPWSESLVKTVSNALGQDISADESLKDGMVISIYSALGTVQGDPVVRQRRGLAVLTPDLTLRYRKNMPILCPDTELESKDSLGIEDARVTYYSGKFFLWYCGYDGKHGLACCAWSEDLIHWQKQNPVPGDFGETDNKDHVIFPEPFNGKWWMLHRPWGDAAGSADDYVIRLASAPSPFGPWTDEGELLRGLPSPEKRLSWVGAGSPPVKLQGGKYLLLYHNGCFFHDGSREYDACVCVIDLSEYRKGDLSGMITCRTEPLMVPETAEEKNSELKIDIVFPMSAHIYGGDLYFLYGAGDKATCGARIPFGRLLALISPDEKDRKKSVRDHLSPLPEWAIGPFYKAPENPVVVPGNTGFDSWAAYNPAVVCANGEYHMFYRAEDIAERGTPYCGTSRIGRAVSKDGRHFEKKGLALDADQSYELPGGLEDPRIVIVDGVYHLLYTAYCWPKVILCSAVSTDLIHWEKRGPLFTEWTKAGKESKSACVIVNPSLEAVKIQGSYRMFSNEVYAVSEDFIHWECEPFCTSAYSGRLNEVCTAVTDYRNPGEDDIVLFVAGTLDYLCPEQNLFYGISECLLDRNDPRKQIAKLNVPVIRAEYPYEKSLERLSGEAARGTIFLDSVFRKDGVWHAYYGASDAFVGAAFTAL